MAQHRASREGKTEAIIQAEATGRLSSSVESLMRTRRTSNFDTLSHDTLHARQTSRAQEASRTGKLPALSFGSTGQFQAQPARLAQPASAAQPVRTAERRASERRSYQQSAHANPYTSAESTGWSLGRKALVACLAVALVLVAVQVIGTSFFASHLLPGTYVNGFDVSLMSADAATAATSADAWRYTITEGSESWELSASDVSLEATPIDFAAYLAEQPNEAWLSYVIGSKRGSRRVITQQSSYSREVAIAAVDSLPFAQAAQRTAPADAYAEYDSAEGLYAIHPEELGTQVDVPVVEAALLAALDLHCEPPAAVETQQAGNIAYAAEAGSISGSSELSASEVAALEPSDVDPDGFDISASEAYLRPEILASNESLIEAVEKANVWLGAEITYDLDGFVAAETVGKTLLREWVGIERVEGEDPARFVATYDSTAVKAWLREIGEKYDTEFLGHKITTGSGETRYVTGGGSYGWITDEASEYEALTADINSGNVVHRSFTMKQTGSTPKAIRDDLYIEVSIDAQHAWLYDNGEVFWDARVVTGASWFPTVTGTYEIYAKQQNVVLVGEDLDNDGEPDYMSNVNYWMPFYGGYGLHDAVGWRGNDPSNYGGDIHWSGGSHGCVNFTLDDAEYLYNTVEIGTTVYVH